MNYRLTEAAAADIAEILRETARRFGPVQRARYAALLEQAAELVAGAPERSGSRVRDDLAPGVHSFHVEVAAGRRGAAAHILYYLLARSEDEWEGVIVVRVLHERMEPLRHLTRGLP